MLRYPAQFNIYSIAINTVYLPRNLLDVGHVN